VLLALLPFFMVLAMACSAVSSVDGLINGTEEQELDSKIEA
jgi:hypothetical protein